MLLLGHGLPIAVWSWATACQSPPLFYKFYVLQMPIDFLHNSISKVFLLSFLYLGIFSSTLSSMLSRMLIHIVFIGLSSGSSFKITFLCLLAWPRNICLFYLDYVFCVIKYYLALSILLDQSCDVSKLLVLVLGLKVKLFYTHKITDLLLLPVLVLWLESLPVVYVYDHNVPCKY